MTKKFFSKENFVPITSIFALTAVLLAAGFYFGYVQGERSVTPTTILPDGTTVEADFDIFWEAWEKLRANHVNAASSTDKGLLYGAITGLAGSFKDPHTIFFPPQEATKFIEDVSGSFGGIGAEIGNTDGFTTVITPIKNSPAERAGLLAGDIILKVNSTSTEFLSVNEAVSMIRGRIGTPVTLTIIRKDWLQPREIQIVRDRIVVPTLDMEFLEDKTIAHIELYAFNENAPEMFSEMIQEMLETGARGMILDLRNNPGGYLEVAQNLAGWFLEKDAVVVTERFYDGREEAFLSYGPSVLKNFPIIVLINQGSASAAEILAGALRDHNSVTIVGARSYGKGTVQELFPLTDGSSLKITTAHWVMPGGLVLEGNGIEPDVEVELSDEDIKAKKDVQLEKAVELLKAKIGLSKTQAVR